jgi:hypothetical protein
MPALLICAAGDRLQRIKSKRFGSYLDAEARHLTRQPKRARLVTSCPGTMNALRIQRCQPRNGSGFGIIKTPRLGMTEKDCRCSWILSASPAPVYRTQIGPGFERTCRNGSTG